MTEERGIAAIHDVMPPFGAVRRTSQPSSAKRRAIQRERESGAGSRERRRAAQALSDAVAPNTPVPR